MDGRIFEGGILSVMKQEHKDSAGIGARLAELRGLPIFAAEREKVKRGTVVGIRRLFRGRFIIAAVALLGLSGTGGLLHAGDAVDALFIDKEGHVSIGTSTSKANLDVSGTVKAEEFMTDKGASLGEVKNAVTGVQKDVQALNLHVPVGTITAYGGDTANMAAANRLREQGWLPCNGISVSREEYKELYNVIGSAFGSISDTTFQIPDMRGLFLRGVDQGSKRDPEAGLRQAPAPNGNAGDKVGSVQEDQLKTHKHTVNAAHAGQAGGRSTGDPIAVAGWPRNHANKEIEAAGGAETRPKNIYVNWIIKAKHTLPLQP